MTLTALQKNPWACKKLKWMIFMLFLFAQFGFITITHTNGDEQRTAQSVMDLRNSLIERYQKIREKLNQEGTAGLNIERIRSIDLEAREAFREGDYNRTNELLKLLEDLVAGREDTAEEIFDEHCTVTRSNPNVSPFGVHFSSWEITVMNNPRSIPAVVKIIDELGVQWVRLDVLWEFTEPRPGHYDWSTIDQIVERCSPDTSFVFTLFTLSTWACRKGPQFTRRALPAPNYPHDIKVYRRYITHIVQRYKHRVKYWQIDNEVYGAPKFWGGSPEEYLTVLKVASETIRKIDPEARILAAGISLGDLDVYNTRALQAPKVKEALRFMDLVYNKGGRFFDILDLHSYWKWEAIPDRIDFINQRVSRHGAQKPIWITETAGPDLRAYLSPKDFNYIESELNRVTKTDDPSKEKVLRSNRWSEVVYFDEYDDERYKLQAQELVKRFVLALYGGAEIVYWHKLIPEGPDLFWNRMALIDHTGKRRDGFVAYTLLMRELSGFESISRIKSREGVFVFMVNKPQGREYIMWSEQPTLFDIEYLKPRAHVITTDGTETFIEPKANKIRINLTPAPLFVK
jgi:hypothetical protein